MKKSILKLSLIISVMAGLIVPQNIMADQKKPGLVKRSIYGAANAACIVGATFAGISVGLGKSFGLPLWKIGSVFYNLGTDSGNNLLVQEIINATNPVRSKIVVDFKENFSENAFKDLMNHTINKYELGLIVSQVEPILNPKFIDNSGLNSVIKVVKDYSNCDSVKSLEEIGKEYGDEATKIAASHTQEYLNNADVFKNIAKWTAIYIGGYFAIKWSAKLIYKRYKKFRKAR